MVLNIFICLFIFNFERDCVPLLLFKLINPLHGDYIYIFCVRFILLLELFSYKKKKKVKDTDFTFLLLFKMFVPIHTPFPNKRGVSWPFIMLRFVSQFTLPLPPTNDTRFNTCLYLNDQKQTVKSFAQGDHLSFS